MYVELIITPCKMPRAVSLALSQIDMIDTQAHAVTTRQADDHVEVGFWWDTDVFNVGELHTRLQLHPSQQIVVTRITPFEITVPDHMYLVTELMENPGEIYGIYHDLEDPSYNYLVMRQTQEGLEELVTAKTLSLALHFVAVSMDETRAEIAAEDAEWNDALGPEL